LGTVRLPWTQFVTTRRVAPCLLYRPCGVMDRAEERAGPEDVGDQALMRGLVTAFPFVRPGLSLSEVAAPRGEFSVMAGVLDKGHQRLLTTLLHRASRQLWATNGHIRDDRAAPQRSPCCRAASAGCVKLDSCRPLDRRGDDRLPF
jgi:hypothetical protein